MSKKEIINYLEKECCFRDYRFKNAKYWAKTSIPRSINLLNPDEHELSDALSVFARDGYSQIIIYLGETCKHDAIKLTGKFETETLDCHCGFSIPF